MGCRVSLGVLEKMSYFPLFMIPRLVLMFPRHNFSDEARKPAHGVAHLACLACCSVQIVKSFLLLYLASNAVKRKEKRLEY
jgi:hypothetical protein